MKFPSKKLPLGSGISHRSARAFAVGQQVFQFAHVELQLVNVLPSGSSQSGSLFKGQDMKGTMMCSRHSWKHCVCSYSCLFHMFWPLIRNLNIPPFNQHQPAISTVLKSGFGHLLVTSLLSFYHILPFFGPLPWCPSRCQGPRHRWPWWSLTSDGRGTTSCRSRWSHATTSAGGSLGLLGLAIKCYQNLHW